MYVCNTYSHRESVTTSVFILSGTQLKATYSLEGPIAKLDVESGIDLYTKGEEFSRDEGNRKTLSISEEVDFEHLVDEVDDDDYDDDDDVANPYDDDEPILPDDPDKEKKKMERRDRQRKKFVDLKKKREEKKIAALKAIKEWGEPIENTEKAPKAGWYRMCVTGTYNQVSKPEGNESIPVCVSFFE
jgi:hypothetical protein